LGKGFIREEGLISREGFLRGRLSGEVGILERRAGYLERVFRGGCLGKGIRLLEKKAGYLERVF
jgi:hypothetical protein